MAIHYEGALTKIQADQILSNFLGKAKVTEKIFSFEYIDLKNQSIKQFHLFQKI